jgi:hypothetical protein
VKLEKAQTRRHCQLEESANGLIVNAKTQQPFTWRDACVEYGVTIAYDEKASTDATRAVREFVTTVLKP